MEGAVERPTSESSRKEGNGMNLSILTHWEIIYKIGKVIDDI